jgi:hypothetical protein
MFILKIVDHTIAAAKDASMNFVVSHLHVVEDHLKRIKLLYYPLSFEPPFKLGLVGTTYESHVEGIDSAFASVDEAVSRIYEELPLDALFMVFTGHGDIHVVKRSHIPFLSPRSVFD